MSAYISKTWETADALTYAPTTEGNDSATSTYYIFDAPDEPAAMAALRANAPATYAIGDRVLPVNSYTVSERKGQTTWVGTVAYASTGGTSGQALAGSLYFSGTATPGGTLSLTLDLVTPEQARQGGQTAWYIDGVYQTTAASYTIANDNSLIGKELLATYTHERYSGDLQKSTQIGDAENLGGTLAIIGRPPAMQVTDPITLTADLSEVSPTAAQTGGLYSWTQNGAEISTTGTASVTMPGNVQLVYSHNGYGKTLKAIATPPGGDSGGGISRDTTISFNLSSTSTTRTVFSKDAIKQQGRWSQGDYRLRGYNPDSEGNPQGIEFQTHALSFTFTIWRSPSYFTMSFLNRLDSYADCINANTFLGFPARSVLFAGVTGNRSGTKTSDYWGLGLTFLIRKPETVKFDVFYDSASAPLYQPQEVTKGGWDVLNVMNKSLPVNGRQTVAAVAWNVATEYEEKDFTWLAEEIGKVIS